MDDAVLQTGKMLPYAAAITTMNPAILPVLERIDDASSHLATVRHTGLPLV